MQVSGLEWKGKSIEGVLDCKPQVHAHMFELFFLGFRVER